MMEQQLVINWTKSEHNPISSLAPEIGTWRAEMTMTVDLLQRGETYQIFYVGKKDGKDSIGIAFCPIDEFDGLLWKDYELNPILSPGISGSFDSRHVVDPASVVMGEKIFLYYSALGDGPDSIGLATSEDGLLFTKHEKPILIGRAPEVVSHEGTLYLFYSMDNLKGGYEFHLATSADGYHFTEEGPVFIPSDGDWDGLSVITPRIFHEDGVFIMTYAGDNHEKDYPLNFGVAFSSDLRHWKRYPKNPVFSSGTGMEWDSRAIWFPEILKHNHKYFLWYEGNDGIRSQVGLAYSDSPIAEIGKNLLD